MDNETPIILCCGKNGRAVVYGYVDEPPKAGRPVTLRRAKMVLRWPSECKGLFGLAANGPKSGTRLTPAVQSTTETTWQEWVQVSQAAAEGLDSWQD